MKEKPFSEMEKRKPLQLLLFEELPEEDKKHSNTVALYDLMPKYVYNSSALQRSESIDGEFSSFKPIRRQFEYAGVLYDLKITPARLEKDGKFIDYFPGEREEIIHMAILKIAIKKRRTQFVESKFMGVPFSFYELRKELVRIGKKYSLDEIKDSIRIMHLSGIEISADGVAMISSSLYPVIGIRQQQPDGSEATFVLFHPFLRDAIEEMEFRQIDYALNSSLRSYVARWVHIKLTHQYRQASPLADPYNFSARNAIRDAGMPHKEFRGAIRHIRKALDELKTKGIVQSYDEKSVCDQDDKRKIIDIIFYVRVTTHFSNEQRRANAIHRDLEQRHVVSRDKREIVQLPGLASRKRI